MFNYKEELKSYFKSVGGNGTGCERVSCSECMFHSDNFEDDNARCIGTIYAEECIELVRKWSEEHPREIDWTKVPIDTKVEVRDYESYDWETRYYCSFLPASDSKYACFAYHQRQENAEQIIEWRYCRLHPDTEIKEEWYK